ncbi:MAG: hypothetical protein ACREVK_03225 [Gammaproteobacteria bacterium]
MRTIHRCLFVRMAHATHAEIPILYPFLGMPVRSARTSTRNRLRFADRVDPGHSARR